MDQITVSSAALALRAEKPLTPAMISALWEIAAVADPQRDTREVMNDIAELNGLTSSTLHTGQVLEVPSR